MVAAFSIEPGDDQVCAMIKPGDSLLYANALWTCISVVGSVVVLFGAREQHLITTNQRDMKWYLNTAAWIRVNK